MSARIGHAWAPSAQLIAAFRVDLIDAQQLNSRSQVSGTSPRETRCWVHVAGGRGLTCWQQKPWKADLQVMEDGTRRQDNLRAYDSVSGWWRGVAETGNHRLWIEIPTMRRLAGNLTGQDVMALGCGTGREIVWLLEQGAKTVLGVDGSPEQLRQAREQVGDRAELVCADIELWAMPEARFDLVISSLLLDHIGSLDVVLGSIRDALRVGGRAIFSLPHPVLIGSEHPEDYSRCVLGYDIDEAEVFGDYLSEREIVIGLGPNREYELRIWARSVSRILTSVLNAGMTITAVEEPCPPEPAAGDPSALREFKLRYRRLPRYLVVAASRPAGGA